MEGLRDGFAGVMMVKNRHSRIDRMYRVSRADRLAHVGGKGCAHDHESECERQQALSHLKPVYRIPLSSPAIDQVL